MNRGFFHIQLNRLKSQWPNSFGEERTDLIWGAFELVSDRVFRDAVSHLIANERSAPVIPNFEEAINQVMAKQNESSRRQDVSVPALLQEAASVNRTANKDYINACLKLLEEKTSGKITRAQWLEGCDALDTLAAAIAQNKMCGKCSDSGYMFKTENSYETLYRCTCAIGRLREENMVHLDSRGNERSFAVPVGGINP